MGIVHGGVYCSVIEAVASTSAYVWLAEHGAATSWASTTTPTLRHLVGHAARGVRAGPPRPPAAVLVTITDERDRVIARGQVRLQNLEADAGV